MKEKTVLITILSIGLMLAMTLAFPAKAWDYYNTSVGPAPTYANSAEDTYIDFSGPRADKIFITMYASTETEFTALETGVIDMTDWPVDNVHYGLWTTPPLNASIAVVNTGTEFSLYEIDFRVDNRTTIDYPYAGTDPNPAYYWHEDTSPTLEPYGNPMADVWLRRAISTTCDRNTIINTIIDGTPRLATALYTVLGG
jgi:ABC-type transport system substrate-binding protein